MTNRLNKLAYRKTDRILRRLDNDHFPRISRGRVLDTFRSWQDPLPNPENHVLDVAFPDMPPPPSPLPICSLADPTDFKAQMEAGGFHEVAVEFPSQELEVQTFDELWAMFTVGAPAVQVLFDRVGARGERRLRDALREIVEERFGTGPIMTTNVATVAVGSA